MCPVAIYILSRVIRIKNLVERCLSTVRAIWLERCAYHMGLKLILHLIFIGFKLDGELFAAVTFTTSLCVDPARRQKGGMKLLFPISTLPSNLDGRYQDA